MGIEKRRVSRVVLQKPVRVEISSIGSDIKYKLETYDISVHGFFFKFDKPGRFPFISSSIMEVWLFPDKGEQIFFNGRLARLVLPGTAEAEVSGPGIAVRIIQITPEEEKKLGEFVRKIQEKQGEFSELKAS